jgi:hypothetical protein
VTAEEFRRIALGFPEAEEQSHMGHPDFRVRGKIFATLAASGDRSVVKLRPEQQEVLVQAEPELFAPSNGAWGLKGWTNLQLGPADEAAVRSALAMAWRNTAPAKLAAGSGEGPP